MLAKFGGLFSFSQIFKKGKNMPKAKTKRELTTGERRSIRKLVTGSCANYDSEYGCLPLECECPMLGVCYTSSACAGTFGNQYCQTIPNWKRPCRRCPPDAVSTAANRFRSMGVEPTAPTNARKHLGKSRPQPGCANSGAKRLCNAFALKSYCSATTF